MPDIGRPNERPDAMTGEAYAKGEYLLEPQVTPAPKAPPAAAAPEPYVEADDGEEAAHEAPGGHDDYDPPSAYIVDPFIRMVNDDTTATADGFRTDETGAYLVPRAQVEAMRGHGWRVEHIHERAA